MIDEVHDFEGRLVTAFAVDPICHGVSITSWQGPGGPAAKPTKGPQWQLMLDYTVGQPSQDWSMAPPEKTPGTYTNGTGDAAQIIHSVCSVITHMGGAIAE